MVISILKKPGRLPQAVLTAIIPQAGLNDYLMQSLRQPLGISITKAVDPTFDKSLLPRAEDNMLSYKMYSLSLV
ncbi:hypothetical protein [Sphingobacterium sp. G1-14]|uniref:hypothetical protein n=1 Tax=Sphingobacterium TaxID=28453 RepID=UPI0012FE460E|nr:hypothetical protein [Sphingobacterium sp. G1-14]